MAADLFDVVGKGAVGNRQSGIGSLIRGRTTVRDVQALFGHAQAASRRPDGFVYYYTLDVFNPFEDRSGGRR